MIDRRTFLELTAIAALAPRELFAQMPELEELTIAELRRFSARQLTELYLARIDALDKSVNSIIERNPDALAICKERFRGSCRVCPILTQPGHSGCERM